jgi:glycosidase
MPVSSADLLTALEAARTPAAARVRVGRRTVGVSKPFPSPQDWRDQWMYFLLVDRFNNPAAPPRQLPWDGEYDRFQGGTLAGVQARLDYLQQLGVGALWLSPVLQNCQHDETAYHGYGVEDLLAVEPRLTSDPERARQDPSFADAELRALVDAAHARGIYVVLEIVLDPPGNAFRHNGFASVPRDGVPAVRDALIRAYQYAVAAFDVDGFRINTLKFVDPGFVRAFGNAIREYALSIGKRNFLVFAEVHDDQDKTSRFVGRHASDPADLVGVDAALDFPLTYLLPGVAKGFVPPSTLAGMYQYRKQVEAGMLSSHGEASRFFVTFLDNHDRPPRFGYTGDDPARFADQVTLGTTCLFALQGVPCLYYGTEQGLRGAGTSPESVREALWGKAGDRPVTKPGSKPGSKSGSKPGSFDLAHPVAAAVRSLTDIRASEPALRYGRQYFRPVSGDGVHFGVSGFPAGVLAFSRVLSDREVLVVANTNTEEPWTGEVIVDQTLVPADAEIDVLFGNVAGAPPATPKVVDKDAGTVQIQETAGGTTTGPARAVHVTLRPMEVLLLAPARP